MKGIELINFLKFVSLRIANGLLFGIGLVAIFVVGAYYIKSMCDEPSAVAIIGSERGPSKPNEVDFNDELSVVEYKDASSSEGLKILGKIKNDGEITWSGIELQAEMFLKDEFVDECKEYLSKLKPNNEENFKISCGGCGDYTLPEYDRISLRVVSAHKDIF